MRCVLAIIALLALTCAVMAQSSPFQITWSTYRSGENSKIESYQTFTMRNQQDFAAYWEKSTGISGREAPKDIDWLKYEALAIHLGQRKSGGYSVYVQSIDMVTGAEYNVHAIEQGPSDRTTGTIPTSPFTIILLPRRYAKYNVSIVEENASGPGWNSGDDGDHGHGGDDKDRDDGKRDGYRLIERGYLSYGPAQMALDVLRNKSQWNRFWDKALGDAHLTTIGRSRSRSIDWDNNQVVVLQAGPDSLTEPLKITRVAKTATGFRIDVLRSTYFGYDHPNPVYPYIVIELPGHSGKVDINVRYAG